MELKSGDKVDHYEIISPLGKGGMGEVWQARDSRLNRDVAIKFSGQQFSDRFEREARAIAALNHPNICTLYDIGPNYLVMEYISGTPIHGPLPVKEALKYAAQICDALETAHRNGIVHRDLKPTNILLSKRGIKLLDFGLAQMNFGPDDGTITQLTHAGAVMGTPAYMAPEQREGKPADVRSDIYSLGCVLYEMLTGKRVAAGREPLASATLEGIVEGCLAKDPADRWQSASDIRRALGLPVATTAPPQSRNRLWLSLAALLALAIVGTGGAVAWRATRPTDLPLVRLSVDMGPDAIAANNTTAAISPDGRRLAFTIRRTDGHTQLATRLLSDPQAILLAGTDDAADPFFKPDGQWVGFFAGGKMKKVSIMGSAVIVLCDATASRGAAWGEDGNIVATLDSDTGIGLSRIADGGGKPQVITRPGEKGEATHRWPQILPGGEKVLFTGNKTASNYDDSSIELLSLKTGRITAVMSGGYYGRYLETSKGNGVLVYLHQRTLFGVSFDPERMAIRGAAVPLQGDVAGNPNTAAGQFDFSHNGTFVYLSGKASPGTWTFDWLNRDGKLLPLLTTPGVYYQPRLSPDGKRLAFSTNSDIEVYDIEREISTQLTFTAQTRTNFVPVWMPDGKHIVFQSQSTGNWSLQWIRADGSGEAQQLRESKRRIAPYSISPDGKRLAFYEQNADNRYDLWTLRLETDDSGHAKTGTPELFLHTAFDQREPAFSPDGRWLAYVSTDSGRDEVYVRPFEGEPDRSGKWQISTAGGRSPVWAHDGKELFYEGLDNHIQSVDYLAKGNSFAAAKPRIWSTTPVTALADATPDGKRFVVTGSLQADAAGEPKGSVHVVFLLNYFDEIRRRVSAGLSP